MLQNLRSSRINQNKRSWQGNAVWNSANALCLLAFASEILIQHLILGQDHATIPWLQVQTHAKHSDFTNPDTAEHLILRQDHAKIPGLQVQTHAKHSDQLFQKRILLHFPDTPGPKPWQTHSSAASLIFTASPRCRQWRSTETYLTYIPIYVLCIL